VQPVTSKKIVDILFVSTVSLFFSLHNNKNMSTKENFMPLSEKRENVNARLTYTIDWN
jgi:hypothetical protein